MSQVEHAVAYVRKRGFARTTDLARELGMIPGDVDLLLAGNSAFVTCDVQVGESKLKEYRLSTAPTHNLRAGPKSPPTPPVQASTAPDKSLRAPVSTAAPVPEAPKENAMEGTIIDRALAALKKHGPLSLDELAKHAGTTKGSMSTYTGTLVKKHGVRRVHGERGVYELGDGKAEKPRQRDALAAGGELGRRKNGTPDKLYAAALLDLQDKRQALVEQLAKLDRAIEAVEALA